MSLLLKTSVSPCYHTGNIDDLFKQLPFRYLNPGEMNFTLFDPVLYKATGIQVHPVSLEISNSSHKSLL